MRRKYAFKKVWKRYLAFVFDLIGSVFTFWIPRNQSISALAVKKILLVRIDHLGDALLLRPAIAALRKAQPQFKIHLLTTPENLPVFQLDSFIDRAIPFTGHWFLKNISSFEKIKSFFDILGLIRKEKYDACVDFRGDVRVNLLMLLAGIPIRLGYGITGGGWMLTHERLGNVKDHQVLLNQKMLGDWIICDVQLKNTPVGYPVATVAKLNEKISKVVQWPYAVVHMGAGNPLKEWPAEHFKSLMEKLIATGLVKVFFLVGTQGEREITLAPPNKNTFDLRGKTDLHELTSLLDGAIFFIGNDSGPAHLAAAQGIPVVVLASHTNNIKTWHPWTKRLCMLLASMGELVSVEQAETGVLSLMSQGS